MKNNTNLKKYLYLFLFISIIDIAFGKILHEFDISSSFNKTNKDLEPLSFISSDQICPTYIPSLFSPISLVKYGEYSKVFPQDYYITIDNPVIEESRYEVYIGNLTDNNIKTYFGIKQTMTDEKCYFGLSSKFPEIEAKYKDTTLDYLKNTNQIDEKKFSLDKWDLNWEENIIRSKLYLGYNHKDFDSQNKKYIGTCENIKEDTYWGCYFDQMIFNNVKIPLNKEYEEYYKIYFSSEDYVIRFPDDFKDIFFNVTNGSCQYNTLKKITTCTGFFKEEFFIPLTLSNDNMDITLEIDSLKRFNSDDSVEQDSIRMIFDEEIDYIIFPLKMFKNFHTQFDADSNMIKFYSTDKNILHVKINEPEEDENSSSTALIVFFIIITIIILIALGFGIFYFIKIKGKDNSKEINKFTKYDDEDDFKNEKKES